MFLLNFENVYLLRILQKIITFNTPPFLYYFFKLNIQKYVLIELK